MTYPKQLARRILFVVVTMIFILGFGIDLYTPAFPTLARSFQTTDQLVQLTISTYFWGYVIGMILIGPLLDRFGRKKPILIGLSYYCVMSLLCSLSTTITMLLTLRFLQGFGATVIGVGFRSILSDAFSGKKLATSMTYASMSYRIGPIIAPFLGGYLTVYLGWQSNFYFLALYGLLLIGIVAIFLPETHLERLVFRPKEVFQRYLHLFKHPPFLGASLCVGIFYGMIIVFNVIAPFFIQDILGYSPIAYGHIALMIGGFSFIGIVLNRFLLHKLEREKIIKLGVYTILVSIVLQVLAALLFPTNLYSFIIPVILIFSATGFINSNMMSNALDLIPIGKGTASALMGILLIFCASVLTAVSSFLKSNTIIPFAFAFLAMFILCFLSYYFLYENRHYRSNGSRR